ncbi:hypothetical protein K1T71_000124 [Dendrolimus kikuchii]|uniref:Uncharacterized protein n=1 Tax=Dendrolimus kikuchii TaxID=765133 RepID=A0ACC1DII7_9NEOP|nr:hypothetical protein K1T71_000124 [Dendrolimus kikuchii]
MEAIGRDRENLNSFLQEAELQHYYELFRNLLKVTKVSQLKFVVTEDLVQIGMSKPEQRRYKKIYSKYFPNPYIKRIRKILSSKKKRDPYIQGQSSIGIELQPFPENNVKVPTKHIISIEDITINKELGMGQFGVVQQGTWSAGNQRLQVAIKCLGHERMTSNSTEFLKEAAVMHSIEHPNIVRLYGVVLHLDSLMLVTELAPLRSLLECLREVSLRPSFPVPNLCEFAEQICDGMAYLERKRLIHRDLAARNILVFSKDRVKISDFGLSRALGVGKDYYQTNYNVNLKLPVAWCAPECILYLRFTSSSDVWAFGVCLWEMFTYGFQPWAAFSGHQILETIDAPNFQRLERPDCCPDAYYTTMLECWAHEPNNRPKFKELILKLRDIRPEQVQAMVNSQRFEDGRRSNFLKFKSGEIITVLGKEIMTSTSLWYGILTGGTSGMFDPNQTKPYIKPEPPRQVVSPYKPSEDLEQVPLINPNSPSHLSGACCSPYPLLNSRSNIKPGSAGTNLPYAEPKTRYLKKQIHKTSLEPTTSKSILNKVKSATLGRSHKNEESRFPKLDEVHEYHEISDTDTESPAADNKRTEHFKLPDSSGVPKGHNDFSQSLLDEMESMFRSLDGRRRGESNPANKNFNPDNASKTRTINKTDKKKNVNTGIMKPMSAHDEKTLDTAVALANEITAKSMNDLGVVKPQKSPSERHKFHFKFPHLTLHHKDKSTKQERRNFSEEARSVPDIQATITEESRQAYMSLIEEPTNSSSLMSHITNEATGTLPKPSTALTSASRKTDSQTRFNSLQKQMPLSVVKKRVSIEDSPKNETKGVIQNVLPLPPRNTKPKLIDQRRHIRKYPLKIPEHENVYELPSTSGTAIYQNAMSCSVIKTTQHCDDNHENGIDVRDAPDSSKTYTNPFKPRRVANPFDYVDTVEVDLDTGLIMGEEGYKTDDNKNKGVDRSGAMKAKNTLVKEHVSVEDLLEFANRKPRGRQRGVESDEVRIMNKVLKQQATPEECLRALELCEWNVHQAIKVSRVKISAGIEVSLGLCLRELAKANGDIVKAAAILILNEQNSK